MTGALRCRAARGLWALLILVMGSAAPSFADSSLLRMYMWRAPGCLQGGEQSQTANIAAAAATYMDSLAYLEDRAQPVFGYSLKRIGGTTLADYSATIPATVSGTQLTLAAGTWGFDTRHGYSKRQPWDHDEALYLIENPTTTYDSTGSSGKASGAVNDGDGSVIALEASSWQPTSYYQCGRTSYRDERWLPFQPGRLVALDQATAFKATGADSAASHVGDSLVVLNARTCAIISGVALDFKANTIGAGEGTVGYDDEKNCYVALHFNRYNQNPGLAQKAQVFKIDPDGIVTKGAVFTIPRCSLQTECVAAPVDSMEDCDIGHVQVSATGEHLIVHYNDDAFGGGAGCTSGPYGADAMRVFPIDRSTLTIGPEPMKYSAAAEGCDTRQLGGLPTWRNFSGTWWSNGYLRSQNHPDVARNPYTGKAVTIGGRRCGNWNGSSRGRVEMQDLDTAAMTFLSDPSSEAPVQHVSARNYLRPEWVVVSHDIGTTARRENELVLYRLDGGAALRVAQLHTQDNGGKYRGESHPVASPSLTRIAFASSWRTYTNQRAPLSDATAKLLQWKDYVLELGGACLP